MTPTTPCYRHSREVWIAACPDCTTWHLAAARARRDEVVARSPVTRLGPTGRVGADVAPMAPRRAA